MKPKPDTTVKLIAAASIGISLFVGAILLMRAVNRGDGTPPGSTHRTDPRGCKALYQALAHIPELKVERNHHQFSQCVLPTDATLFLQGCGPVFNVQMKRKHSFDLFTLDQFLPIDEFVRKGGRLVVTISDTPGIDEDEGAPWLNELPSPGDTIPRPAPGIPGAKMEPIPVDDNYLTPFIRNWGLDVETSKLKLSEDELRFIPVLAKPADPDRFPRLQWHSRYTLNRQKSGWKPIYRRGKKIVMAERKLGRGSVVVASDNFFLSNQGLRETPSGGLIVWLLGGHRHVIIDEWHLGVGEPVGVATLFYRYRLQWFVAAIAFIALLFVWRSMSPLAPYPEYHMDRSFDDEALDGRDASAGYVQLLRRFISPKDILGICYDEWQKDVGVKKPISDEIDADIRNLVTDEDVKRNEALVVAAYERISKDLE